MTLTKVHVDCSIIRAQHILLYSSAQKVDSHASLLHHFYTINICPANYFKIRWALNKKAVCLC